MHDFSVLGTPPLLAAAVAGYLLLSVVAFVDYARDKAAARVGRRRMSERRLLLLGLAGGWPGALLAQRLLRHKCAKASFQLRFWCSVLLNLSVMGWLAKAGCA